jgi:hypothetical protein
VAPIQAAVGIGLCRLGVIKGEDKNGKMVEYISEKKGFMGRGEYLWCDSDVQPS